MPQTDAVPVGEFELQLTKPDARTVRDNWSKILVRTPQAPDGAIASARALIESTCKTILDQLDLEYHSSDDLVRLYKRMADLAPAVLQ
jgi:hypothetical protein